MKKTALLSAVLAALCLASAVGCGDTTTGVETPDKPSAGTASLTDAVTDAVTEPGYPAPDTSELDFGGAAVRFIAPEWGTYTYYFTDEMDGEAVNDAAFTRLSNVQNALNCKIEYVWSTDADCHSTVIRSVTAGDDAYDIVFTHSIYGISDYAVAHALYNLDNLPHLNFEAPWWSKSMIDDFRIGSETIYATGDIILGQPPAILFNKSISSNFDLPDHYEAVRSGKWTYDYMLTEAKMVSQDVNGDGKIDRNDQTGFSQDMTEALCNIPYALGEAITKSTDDGLELVFYSEKMVDIFKKTYDYFLDSENCNAYFRFFKDDGQGFEEGLSLFGFANVSSMAYLRDYDLDFGALPYPKFDEAQAEYRTYAWPRFVCVPTTVTKADLVGAALEQFAYESTAVRNAYNEILIRGKSARDVETLEMLDIIANSLVCDIGPSYLGFDAQFHKVFYCFYELLSTKKDNITSHYEKAEKSVQKVIDKLYDKVISAQES